MDHILIERLAGHQRSIRGIMDIARPLLEEGASPQPLELGRLRWQMVRALTAYQQFKHREIFDPAIVRNTGPLAQMGAALKADCIEIGECFTGYVRDWSGRGTGAEWPTYRVAALAMIGRIDRHLDREQRNVASLLRATRVAAAAPAGPGRPR